MGQNAITSNECKMAKLSKKRKAANAKVDAEKLYDLGDALALIKEVNTTKFDASVDVHVRLGVDPRKADQALRGTVSLPHGTGKTKRVLVFATPDKEQEAKDAGADYVGLDDMIQKVSGGWTDFDVVVAMPQVMAKVGRLGRILGPRGLMPNPKTGTVTPDVGAAVADVKGGKISFRVDKFGIIHASIGRVSFSPDKLTDNANELLGTLLRMKPSSAKGTYMKSVTVASTMSPGIKIDPHEAGKFLDPYFRQTNPGLIKVFEFLRPRCTDQCTVTAIAPGVILANEYFLALAATGIDQSGSTMLANIVKSTQLTVFTPNNQNALIEYFTGDKLTWFGQLTAMGCQAPALVKNGPFFSFHDVWIVIEARR